ncbi:MAG: hypothetical protein R2762_26720 [Bryobacteraceae bacterium]
MAIQEATGAEREILRIPEDWNLGAPFNPGLRLSLSPDGRSVATSRLRFESDIWMLENFLPPRGIRGRLKSRMVAEPRV